MSNDILSASEREEHLHFCKDFIEHKCIFRSPPGQGLLVSKSGSLNTWQFFMRVALLNGGFARRISALFWDDMLSEAQERPFQIGACDTGGVPLACAIQSYGHKLGINVPVFVIKAKPKDYGLFNWLEGCVSPDLPVLIVDDIVASQATLVENAVKCQLLAGLGLGAHSFSTTSCRNRQNFTQVMKSQIAGCRTTLFVYFHLDDFTLNWTDYVKKYGRDPKYDGC